MNVGGWAGGEGAGERRAAERSASLAAAEANYEKTHGGAAAKGKAAATETEWEARDDPASGRQFYWNSETGATTWDIGETDLPQPEESETDSDEDSGSDDGSSGSESESEDHGPLPDGWAEVDDPASGRTYYHNGVTGESSWTFPEAA